jgi:hypothetical protein
MIFVEDALVEHRHPENLLTYIRRKFCYASWAPNIYRLYPTKILSDSRTPASLRWQLLLVSLALASLPVTVLYPKAFFVGLGCLLGWIALSFPTVRRAGRKSATLGMVAPFFVLLGNLAFIAGTVWGLVARTGFRSRR